MIKLVSYASQNMTFSLNKCAEYALKNGVNEVQLWLELDLSDDFKFWNKDILKKERGAGYWIWKPYVIFEEISNCSENDILIYSDAGVIFNTPIHHIIKRMDQDILFFGNTHRHIDWCKRDCLEKMNYQGPQDHEQVQASVILFKVNQKTIDFVKEWLCWAQMPGMIDDSPSKLPEPPNFKEHRHDQAILTNLAIRDGYKMHHWAAQYNQGNHVHYNDNFPFPLFIHHRKRNNQWT